MRAAETDVVLIQAMTSTSNFQVTIGHMLTQETGVAHASLTDLAERYEEVGRLLRRRATALRDGRP